MNIDTWCKKWNVPPEAVAELLNYPFTESRLSGMSEAAVQQRVELAHSKSGGILWRNNVGACTDEHGNFIRYGLANKSKKMNQSIKSSDLIGITPVVVTADMVGHTVGIFTAVECKEGDWSYKDTAHERAQLKYIRLVQSLGGYGRFENGSGIKNPTLTPGRKPHRV